MGTKRSKKKRDAAKRAAEQAADVHDGGPTPPAGTAQGEQKAAGKEAGLWPQHDETLVMPFLIVACACSRKYLLSCLAGSVSVKVVATCHLPFVEQLMCM